MRNVILSGALALAMLTPAFAQGGNEGSQSHATSTQSTAKAASSVPLVTGARMLSREEEAGKAGKHICVSLGRYWFVCVPNAFVHRHPPGL